MSTCTICSGASMVILRVRVRGRFRVRVGVRVRVRVRGRVRGRVCASMVILGCIYPRSKQKC